MEDPVTIDNPFVVLALDRLYRKAMQAFEATTLLLAAREVAKVLRVAAVRLSPEGYYATDSALTEHFRLMRALQEVPESREHEVTALPEFRRLWDVANSPVYGHPDRAGKLLPQAVDALGQALKSVAPVWTIARILPAARQAAVDDDDYSLVGLAARLEDAVLLVAVRETVVLYAQVMAVGLPPAPTFEWNVDPDFARQANRFVDAFNALVPNALPLIIPQNAELLYEPYWHISRLAGRCVRLGFDPRSGQQYHWAICQGTRSGLEVEEFWDETVWTTERYMARRTKRGRCIDRR